MTPTPSDIDEVPVYVGYLNKPYGLKGFELTHSLHPVFKLKDRYIIFLKSETKLVENIKNETYKFFYSVAIPFYMKTLEPFIVFENAKIKA